MKVVRGDLWDGLGSADAVCISTNGYTSRGKAVMGRGCAAQCVQRFPSADLILGTSIAFHGSIVRELFTFQGTSIVAFPVKPVRIRFTDRSQLVRAQRFRFNLGRFVPGWACVADIEMIEESALALVALADEKGWSNVVLPRPGCGAGELKWEDVGPILAAVSGFDDRFKVITYV